MATQIFFIFTPTWGNDSIWLICFNWVETTNQFVMWVWWWDLMNGGKVLPEKVLPEKDVDPPCWNCSMLEMSRNGGNLLTYPVSRSNPTVGSRKHEFLDWKSTKNLEEMDKKMFGLGVSLWYSPLSAYQPWCLEDTPSTSSEFSHPDVAIGHPWVSLRIWVSFQDLTTWNCSSLDVGEDRFLYWFLIYRY